MVLANIFIEWFEDAMLKSAPVFPTVWWRYVDDAFVPLDRSSLPQFHTHINNQWEFIILMKEEEDEQQLPFLDCLISTTKRPIENLRLPIVSYGLTHTTH